MRTFEECWQDHQDALYSLAMRLKLGNVGDADTLCERTRDRAEPKWPVFTNKGQTKKERAWLATIMSRLHITDVRNGWVPKSSGDESVHDGGDSRWSYVPDPASQPGDENWLQTQVLRSAIACVMELITDDPSSYGLTQAEVDLFIQHRFEDLSIREIVALLDMHQAVETNEIQEVTR